MDGYLTARDLMNYTYCPRITFFERVLKIPQTTTVKEYKGRKSHERFTKTSKRSKIAEEFTGFRKQYDVFLEDDALGFRTILDCVIIDDSKNSAYILQAKDSMSPKFIYRTQRLQLIAEAYLARRILGLNIINAYVKYLRDNKLLELKITDVDEQEFLSIISEIKEMINAEAMPKPTKYLKRCNDCCFLNLCKRI